MGRLRCLIIASILCVFLVILTAIITLYPKWLTELTQDVLEAFFGDTLRTPANRLHLYREMQDEAMRQTITRRDMRGMHVPIRMFEFTFNDYMDIIRVFHLDDEAVAEWDYISAIRNGTYESPIRSDPQNVHDSTLRQAVLAFAMRCTAEDNTDEVIMPTIEMIESYILRTTTPINEKALDTLNAIAFHDRLMTGFDNMTESELLLIAWRRSDNPRNLDVSTTIKQGIIDGLSNAHGECETGRVVNCFSAFNFIDASGIIFKTRDVVKHIIMQRCGAEVANGNFTHVTLDKILAEERDHLPDDFIEQLRTEFAAVIDDLQV